MNIYLIILLVFTLLYLFGLGIILFVRYENKPDWSYKFTVRNSGENDTSIDFYINQNKLPKKYKIPAFESFEVELNQSSVKNPRTGGPITKQQLQTITIFFPGDTNLEVISPRDITSVLSSDLPSFNVLDKEIESGSVWSKKGFYQFSLSNGPKRE